MSMMSAKNLRDSILQMAVEGKLVEQRDEEGSAADLLASIRERRAQLVREKKAKPVKGGESVIWRDDAGHWFERRGKGEAVCIDEEIPFDIPDSWCWARMRTVVNVVSARRVHRSDWRTSGIPFYRAREIVRLSQGQSITDALFIDAALYDKLSQSGAPQPGDLMVTGVGTIGTSYVVRQDDCFYYKDASVLCFENRCGFNSLYLQLLMQSAMVVNQIRSLSAGTTVDTLTIRNASLLLIPIAPIAEQKRIIGKIDELMPHIDEYDKAQEQREQLDRELPVKLRKSILQAAVEGKLIEQSDDDESASVLLAGIREQRAQLVRKKKAKPIKGGESVIYRDDAGHWFERRGKDDPVCIDEEIPFDIPDSWCWARMESISNFGTCLNIEYNDVAEGTWNLDLEDIKKDSGIVLRKKCKCNDEQASTKHVFAEGMVLYSKLRPYLNKVIVADENGVCSSEILPIQFEGLDARYAQVFLMSPCFLSFANAHVSGTKMPRLRVADGKQCLIPVPPLAEQECIVEKVNAVLGFVDTIN